MPRPEAVLLALALAGPALAQDEGAPPGWRLDVLAELAGHRALDRVRARPDAVLAPFATDGCSGGQSAVWRLVSERFPAFAARFGDHPPWQPCCVAHDRAYHAGGTPGHGFAERLAADRALGACVRATLVGQPFGLPPEAAAPVAEAVAEAMVLAVRLGGGPCSGLPWRWGYGWPGCSVLTE